MMVDGIEWRWVGLCSGSCRVVGVEHHVYISYGKVGLHWVNWMEGVWLSRQREFQKEIGKEPFHRTSRVIAVQDEVFGGWSIDGIGRSDGIRRR
jgi:hypothetical protein